MIISAPALHNVVVSLHNRWTHSALNTREPITPLPFTTSAHVVNLDPAVEDIVFPPSVYQRELISLENVMEELQLGPNGGSSTVWSEQTDPFPSSEADPTRLVTTSCCHEEVERTAIVSLRYCSLLNKKGRSPLALSLSVSKQSFCKPDTPFGISIHAHSAFFFSPFLQSYGRGEKL